MDQLPFKCETCQRRFDIVEKLEEHMKRKHPQLPSIIQKNFQFIDQAEAQQDNKPFKNQFQVKQQLSVSSVNSAQRPVGAKKLVMRPKQKLPELVQKLQPKQFDNETEALFRDSRIDFNNLPTQQHLQIMQKMQKDSSSNSNLLRQKPPITKSLRSNSNRKDQPPEGKIIPNIIPNLPKAKLQVQRPSSSQIFESKQVKQTVEKEVKIQPEQQQSENQIYSTSDILESKKKITKSLFFQHGGYEQLDKITHLILRQQNFLVFESTSEVPFKQLVSLKSLSLSNNSLINIIGLSELQNLLEINLNNNQIVDISPLNSCKMLQRLWVNNNQIESIQSMSVMIHLEVLTLAQNKLKSFESIMKVLKLLPSLRELEIQGNPCSNRHEYKYDLLWTCFLEKLDGIPINDQDYLLAKAFKVGKKEDGLLTQSQVVKRPITAPRISKSDDEQVQENSEVFDDDGFRSSESKRTDEEMEEALNEAYQENHILREKIDKLENQNLRLSREAERIPYLEQEISELRKMVNSYETLSVIIKNILQILKVFRDSPDQDLRKQLHAMNQMMENLRSENQKLQCENSDLLNDDVSKGSKLRATISTNFNQSTFKETEVTKQEVQCQSEDESDDDKYFKDDQNESNQNSQELMELIMRNSLSLSQIKQDLRSLPKT